MDRYITRRVVDPGHGEQAFYDAYGDGSLARAALKVAVAIPLAIALYAGVVGVGTCLAVVVGTALGCGDLSHLNLLHCTIAG